MGTSGGTAMGDQRGVCVDHCVVWCVERGVRVVGDVVFETVLVGVVVGFRCSRR